MSGHGQFHSLEGHNWVEQLRDVLKYEPPLIDEAVLEAAYDAGEIDTPTMFAYFEGRLSDEQRLEVEAEAAASAHALRKLTRVGAIVAQSRGGAVALGGRSSAAGNVPAASVPQRSASAELPSAGASPPSPAASTRVVHRITLGPPCDSIGGNSLPRAEDCLRISPESPCEFFRSLEKNRDQLRIFHQSAPEGTLVAVRLEEPAAEVLQSPARQFAVLRRGSDSTTTTTLTIPRSCQRAEVILELSEIPLAELTGDDVTCLLNSYANASAEDPVSVTPLHEPRSAWQTWADGVLQAPANFVDPAIREVAELIAGE